MSERCGLLGFHHYDFGLSDLAVLLASATGESWCPWGSDRLLPVSGCFFTLLACCAPLPLRANPAPDGLRWQLEMHPAPAQSLVWVEDTEIWDDLPQQVPLVLREAEASRAASGLVRP